MDRYSLRAPLLHTGFKPRLQIGIYPNARESEEWPNIEAYLQLAAERGNVDIEYGPAWEVWTVHRDGELIAAANVRRLDGNEEAEVTLIGGVDYREWLKPLDQLIGMWAKAEGCTKLSACGRKGWSKVLGWSIVGQEGNMVAYERSLV